MSRLSPPPANYVDYNGFMTVDDPQEYLNAPALIMSDIAPPPPMSPSLPSLPLILQAAVEYSQNFRTLSADELQTYYAEQYDLAGRLQELTNRLEIEHKMREAASSISKLQAGDRGSVYSTKSSKRFSKLLGNAADPFSKTEKRLSKQAADEMLLSTDKINDMELAHLEIERRKTKLDKIILEHHSSVLAKSIIGKPVPNHRRNLSAASAASNITTNTQTSRRSWIVAPQRHQRQLSAVSNADSVSLATVNEHLPVVRPIAQRQCNPNSSEELVHDLQKKHNDELNGLAQQAAKILGNPQHELGDPVIFIGHALDSLSQSLASARQTRHLLEVKTENSETEIAALKRELLEKSTPSARNLPESVSRLNLQHELESEHAKHAKLRSQLESQRQQLTKTTKMLENVTRMSIQLESERAQLHQLLPKLDEKIANLEQKQAAHLHERLAQTANTSRLCQEYQKIVAELLAQHSAEVRSLYPTISRNLLANSAGTKTNANHSPETDSAMNPSANELSDDLSNADLKPPLAFDVADDSRSSYDYEDSIQLTDDELSNQKPNYRDVTKSPSVSRADLAESSAYDDELQ